DIKVDLDKHKRVDLFDEFIASVNEANLTSIDVLNQLNETCLVPICMVSLLEGEEVQFTENGNKVVSEVIEETFQALILEVGRIEIEYNLSESGRITFNKKAFAEYVMKFYPLVVD